MSSDTDREIAGEVTRVEAVKYLQGARGYAAGSLLFLLLAGVLWLASYPGVALVIAFGAALVSANGISIWAWDRLQGYFEGRAERKPEPTRTLTPHAIPRDSLVDMQSGGAMVFTFVGIALFGRVILQVLGWQAFLALGLGGLAVGNVIALVVAVSREA